MRKSTNHKNKIRPSSKKTQRHRRRNVRKTSKRVYINLGGNKRVTMKHAKASAISREKRGSDRALSYRYSLQRAIAGGSKKIHTSNKRNKHIKGGSVNGPIGYGWNGGDVGSWPGVQSSLGVNTNGATMSNHFSLSPDGIVVGGIDPARSTSDDMIMKVPMNGGKQNKRVTKRKARQHGGFFQEIINIGRGAQAGVNGGYFNLIGKQQPISQNPYPTQNQLLSTPSNTINTSHQIPDIRNIYVEANNSAAKM